MMATQTQTRTGTCPAHGRVTASRDLPGMQFPYAWYAVRRLVASRQPFLCPQCGKPVRS